MTPSPYRDAVVICTRNRPEDLRNTLASLSRQANSHALLTIIVDASDEGAALKVKREADQATISPVQYHRYTEIPSLARQRNFALRKLPESVEYVHFIDDDVTLLPHYFTSITSVFDQHADVGGVGGFVIDPPDPNRDPSHALSLRQLFLLDHRTPGRVLISGRLSYPRAEGADLLPVQWLGGCAASFRRSALPIVFFDPRLTGYSLMEDVDATYRLSQTMRLVITPSAQLIHHRSPLNRYSARRYAGAHLVHRFWFVEKNINHSFRKLAFWWSVLGCYLAVLSSPKEAKWEALRGLIDGTLTILRRAHPLLRR